MICSHIFALAVAAKSASSSGSGPVADSLDLLLSKSEALRMSGRYPEAVAAAEEALRLSPDDFDAHSQHAMALHMCDREEEAHVAILRCCSMNPTSGWANNMRASILRSLGRHRESVEAAQLAIALSPNDPSPHCTLAQSFIGLDKGTEALVAAKAAISLDPDLALAHETLGNVYLAMDKNADAERAFLAALERDPERSVSKFNLSVAMRKLGRSDEAIPIVRSLILDDPNDVTNVQAMIDAGKSHVWGGSINRVMLLMLRLAFLRITLVVALLLAPFAWLERRARKAQLAPGTWEAIQAAKKSKPILAAKREGRKDTYKTAGIVLLFVFGVLLLAALSRLVNQ
jgi:tetratricopeptide (TPR) repeat protein